MATVTLYAYDFSERGSSVWWPWTLVSASSNHISLSSQVWQFEYMQIGGDFTVGANDEVSGTATSLGETGPEYLTEKFVIDNISVDAAKLLDLIRAGEPLQMLAYVLSGDDTIIGPYDPATLTGFDGNDTIKAGPQDDTILGDAGDDMIYGAGGIDTVKYAGALADYKIEYTQDGLVMTSLKGDTGTDTLHSIEQIIFADKMLLPVDVNGPTGEIYRLYHAAFGRVPDAAGLNYWTTALEDKGLTLDAIADFFVASGEYQQMYPAGMSNTDLVEKYYTHILGRAPEKAGLDYWGGILDSHAASAAFVLAEISESPEHVQISVPLIGNGIVTDLPIMTA
jgi:Ca2+-binding RTX toxin-like protein